MDFQRKNRYAGCPIELGILCISTVCGISALWYSLVAFIFSGGRARALYRRVKSAIEKLAGAVFIGFGVRLALSE